jgi:hypothetical protein
MLAPALTNTVQMFFLVFKYRFDTPVFYLMKNNVEAALNVLCKVYEEELVRRLITVTGEGESFERSSS